MIEFSAVNVQFLGKKMGAYVLTIVEIVDSIEQIGASGLVIFNNYILDLIWGNDSIHLFDSQGKDENNNLW